MRDSTPNLRGSRGACSARREPSVCDARGKPRGYLALIVALLAFALPAAAQEAREPVVVASKLFTENILLAEALKQIAEAEGHEAVHREQLGGSAILLAALETGEIDAYPEYTGTLLKELLAAEDLRDEDELRRSLRRRGIGMSASLGFNNTYAIGMPEAKAAALGIETISDLGDHPDLRLRLSNEFLDRGDGWPALKAFYGLPHRDVQGIDHDLAYRALDAGNADVIDLYATDAEISYYGLRSLRDDRDFFPRYDAVILFREDLAERAPDVVAAWRRLEGMVEEPTMIAANEAAKIDKRRPEAVAAELLEVVEGGGEITRGSTLPPWPERLWGRRGELGETTLRHLQLVGYSVFAATLVAVPLGVLAAKSRTLGRAVLPTVGVMQTIPSLALLAFMIPILPLAGLPALGAVPTIVALFVYLLLPIVANTHAGITGIPQPIRESAEAIGLSPLRRLWRVELPLASPAILTGIKTSAVIAVGFATLGAFIGAGGYGDPILKGLRLDDTLLILLGAVPAALMAIAMQFGLDAVGRLLIPRGLRS